MATVEFVYETSCPNIRDTRERLIEAFQAAGQVPSWTEWEVGDPAAPERVRALGSPTILVDGRDIVGSTDADLQSCCRLYSTDGPEKGVPPLDVIVSALKGIGQATVRGPSSGLRAVKLNASMLPALGVTLLPKLTCPACWPAYAGLLGSLGVGFVNYTPYLLPLTAGFLAISVLALAWRARSRRGYGPMAVGLLAAAVILVGRFRFDSEPAMWTGLAGLMAASMWNTWPRRGKAPEDVAAACPACDRSDR